MSRDLGDWTVVDSTNDTMTARKDSAQTVFVVSGCRMEDDYDEDGYCGSSGDFDAFTIDGREPTDEEADEYTDDLRTLIREIWDRA